ncbi:MAG TPA: Xaa-Pro peptidase family protein [Candidatus Eisenbacteria bacterium]|nr:Xaa-Pro peptidase family protein [Candidatus Eisenbacteria bacterium]
MTTQTSTRENTMRLDQIQAALLQQGLDGWLLYDFRGLNPIAGRIAGFAPDTHHTRRWFCLLPARGEPRWLHHAIEAHHFADKQGTKLVYAGWREMEANLAEVLKGVRRIAMEYSPKNGVPYVSRVDAGTFELVRSLGVEVVTSADLVSRFEAVWSAEGLESHRKAAAILDECAGRTHHFLQQCGKRGETPTEYEVQQLLAQMLRDRGMTMDSDPIVAVGPHSANPHYAPSAQGSHRVTPGSVVLIDLWGKLDHPGAISADITWMAFQGPRVPDEVQKVWEAVAGARDAAVTFLKARAAARIETQGFEADDVARTVIRERGLEPHFLHRLGHSIGTEVHGNGANLDHFETRDERLLVPHTGFSIEPGVYLEGRFGVRSEIDMYWGDGAAEVTTSVQDRVPALLAG